MTTSEAFIAESPLVQAEMDRLRDLHGVLEKALELAVGEAMPEAKFWQRRRRMDRYIRRAESFLSRSRA